MPTLFALRDAIRADPDLSMAEAAALRTLAEYAAQSGGELGEAWPSLATLASGMCCGRSTAKRAIQALERSGWVRVTRLGSVAHRYRIQIPQRGGQDDPRGGHSDPRGGQDDPRGGVNLTPKECIEETKEEDAEGGHMQRDLFGEPEAPEPEPVAPPFRSHAEARDWGQLMQLWRLVASGSLRTYAHASPARGGGHYLLRTLRAIGLAPAQRAILWMACAPECAYLRSGEIGPRGLDTLWNHRKDYPEKADQWLASDWRAQQAASHYAIPLPEGVARTVIPHPASPEPESTEDSTQRQQAEAAALRSRWDRWKS